MTELPYIPINVNDAVADGADLTNEEFGALWRVRFALWRRGGLLPVDRIARFARAGKRWGAIGPTVLDRLLIEGGMVSCPWVSTILVLTRDRRAAKVTAGRASAAKRRTEGTRFASSVGRLSGHNLLKSHDVDADVLGPSLQQTGNNHNQNKGETPEKSTDQTAEAVEAALSGLPKGVTDRARHLALYRDATTVLMEVGRLTRAQSYKALTDWLKQCGGDADYVGALVARAEVEQFRARQFIMMVSQWSSQRETELTKGFSLPLPPVQVAGGRK